MGKAKKIILFAVASIIGFYILVAAALFFFVDANAYKPRLEAAASAALKMEVSAGRLGIGFFPALFVRLEDVHVRNRGAEVASVEAAKLEIGLIPLLKNNIEIEKISLKGPSISIEQGRDGNFNFETSEAAGGVLPVLNVAKVTFSNGSIHYTDAQSGQVFEAGDCSLDMRHLQHPGGTSADLMKSLSFTAQLACAGIRTKDFTASDLKIVANAKNGVFDLDSDTITTFGAQSAGGIQADFTGSVPHFLVRYTLPQFKIEEFFQTLSPEKVAAGAMDFSATLSMQGKTMNEIRQSAEGQISLRGMNLTLNSRDIDQELSRIESSQNFNLVDVAAFFIAGPVGLVVTKGYNFGSIFQDSGGHSDIRKIISLWKVEHGVAQSQDVALATNENRIAVQGGLDFVNEKFNNVTVAVIDDKGCITVQQQIHGSFQKPVVEKPGILKGLSGPVVSLYDKARSYFPGGECEVFYAGSVAPPK
jgi:AsmA protein